MCLVKFSGGSTPLGNLWWEQVPGGYLEGKEFISFIFGLYGGKL